MLYGQRICYNAWLALTSSSDEGFAKETDTTEGAVTGAGLSCASVGMVSTLPVTGCGV